MNSSILQLNKNNTWSLNKHFNLRTVFILTASYLYRVISASFFYYLNEDSIKASPICIP